MIKEIRKLNPSQEKKLLKPESSKVRFIKSITGSNEILNGQVAYNKYGGYFTPITSKQRPAVRKILNGDVYEPCTIKFIRDNCKNGDIIHAGTFFGDFLPGLSSSMSDRSKIWAFEPNIENFRCAQITSLINNLKNVELFHSGLGEINTTAKMLIKTDSGVHLGGASYILTEPHNNGEIIEVEINRIDEIIPETRSISIIQLDVEGYEKEALSGGLNTIRRCRPILILEDSNKIIDSDWFVENILKLGYEIEGRIHRNTLLIIKTLHNIL